MKVLKLSTTNMNYFKRATTSILRRPGKTVILLLLVFILGSVIAGAISVAGAINATDANLRRNMSPIASITQDWRAFEDAHREEIEAIDWSDPMARWPENPPLTAEHVRRIGALPYVRDFDYTIQTSMRSFDLERVLPQGHFWGSEWEPNWFNLRGTSRTELVQIEQGIMDLVQGDQFENHHLQEGSEVIAALVSREFAELNNLSQGSTFLIQEFIQYPNDEGSIWGWREEDWEPENIFAQIDMELTIVGIFDMEPLEDENINSPEGQSRMDTLNSIFMPNWAIEQFQRKVMEAQSESWATIDEELIPSWALQQQPEDGEEQEMSVMSMFIIDDPTYMDDFREAVVPLLPSPYYMVEDMSSAFDDIASSMETMQTIANWILIVSIIATLLILSLLITLFLRDRRYEMGVYLALGEKRGKIITQILLEVVVTSFLAISLSVFVGSLISGAVSHNMLMNELQAEPTDNWNHGWDWTVFDSLGIPQQTLTVEEMMELYDVSLNIQTIGLFYAIGLGAVIVSTMAPVIYIVTLNPKKVLM